MELASAAAGSNSYLLAIAALQVAIFFLLLLIICCYTCWLATRRRLRVAGFDGPKPSFPLGNLPEITSSCIKPAAAASTNKQQEEKEMHGRVFPYFARWRRSFGKVFVYWLGTEAFLYVADPEFLKSATAGALAGKSWWGKPDVFRRDRTPMFGRGLVMAEGDEWARHRHIISPAFSATNLAHMLRLMAETTDRMLRQWQESVAAAGGNAAVIDVEKGVVRNAAEIIAKASFGVTDEAGALVFQKLQAMQAMLFGQSNRFVGVPMAKLLRLRDTHRAWKLGREIDHLLLRIITNRRRKVLQGNKDLLSLLLAAKEQGGSNKKLRLTTRELVDECKTFFFGGHETTALALSWTLLMLAAHPEWQQALRDEIQDVFFPDGHRQDDDALLLRIISTDSAAAALGRLTKMGWVMSEVLRLYPPSPNVQRQALRDIPIHPSSSSGNGADNIIPSGTNMWVDVVAMHRDPDLWGHDAHLFRPDRFARDPVHGGCRHRMGYLPFGFGGRICVGRNLTAMEYRVVLAMLLRRFHLAVAPQYRHDPKVMLSLRPAHGIHLQLTPLRSGLH